MAKGDGTVYQQGKVWYVRYYRNKKPITKSCPGMTESQARQFLRREIAKDDDQVLTTAEKRVTIGWLFGELIEEYEANGKGDTAANALRSWRLHLKRYFGDLQAHTLTTALQRKYRVERSRDGASVATVNREIAVLSRAYHFAHAQEPPSVKRLPKFVLGEERNVRKGFVTAPQLVALKTAAAAEGAEYRVLVELAHILGWRKNELLTLRVRNIRLHDGGSLGCVRLESDETKNEEAREIPLNMTLRTYLEPMVADRKADDRLFSFRDVRRVWARIAAAAGCPDLLFHDLRRSSARSKRSAGVETSVIMKMQGWKTDSMFRRYAIVSADDKAEALAKQEEYERQLLK